MGWFKFIFIIFILAEKFNSIFRGEIKKKGGEMTLAGCEINLLRARLGRMLLGGPPRSFWFCLLWRRSLSFKHTSTADDKIYNDYSVRVCVGWREMDRAKERKIYVFGFWWQCAAAKYAGVERERVPPLCFASNFTLCAMPMRCSIGVL